MRGAYLLDEYPLIVIPSLATAIGLNKAIVLQQAHYWLQKSDKHKDGHKWFYNRYEDWKEQFPFWSDRTIRRTISDLEKDHLLISGNFNKKKSDKTKWYTIDYKKFNQLMTSPCGQNDQSTWSQCPDGLVNVDTSIPDTTTDIVDEDDEEAHALGNSDGVPTTDPLSGDLLQRERNGEISHIPKAPTRDQAIQQLEQLYLQLRGKGMFPSAKDTAAVAEVVDAKIELHQAIQWTKEVFDNYKPKHPRDTINSFGYVAQYIFNRHHEAIERQKALAGGDQYAKYGTGHGRTHEAKPEAKRKDAGDRPDQKQRLVGKDGEIPDTECDF
jgi:hypothetical protein